MSTPRDTVSRLIEAINRRDLDAALTLYEPSAVFLAQPGRPVQGKAAIREALEGFMALKPVLRGDKDRTIECGDVALFYAAWTLKGAAPDGTPVEMGGVSSDILRRQSNGAWLIAIDNPWGSAVV